MLKLLIYNFTLNSTGLVDSNNNLPFMGKFNFVEDRRSKSLTDIMEELA